MVETLKKARKLGLPDAAQTFPLAEPSHGMRFPRLSKLRLERLSKWLLDKWKAKHTDPCPEFKYHLEQRKTLPVMAEEAQREILRKVNENDVLVVRANTASGKTTQIPQIILDEALSHGRGASCHIAISQPRRISATSVARRVAKERNEPLGESVGYLVRFDSVMPRRSGSLLYCTAGVLLKSLQSNHEMLTTFSHIIIDEVHERSIITDCTLTLLRDLICERKSQQLPYPKLLLMSATISSRGFANYLTRSRYGVQLRSAEIDIGGSLFPVKAQYLQDFLPALEMRREQDPEFLKLLSPARKDDPTRAFIRHELAFSEAMLAKPQTAAVRGFDQPSCDEAEQEGDNINNNNNDDESEALVSDSREDPGALASPIGLIAATIFHVLEESVSGDILVFLVGWNDIERTAELLESHPVLKGKLGDGKELRLFKLHSSLTETNDRVFDEIPAGCRRIVLATNIAETSITLPNVEHVIDTGKIRQRFFNEQNGLDTFPARWISKSNRQQREGRAGRVRPGNYYGLFTRERAESFDEITPAEMTRVDLTEASLDLKASPIVSAVREFFQRTPTPPKPEAVEHALQYLHRLGALTMDERITPLGKVLARTPVHPSMMRAALMGVLFQCLEPMLIIACLEIDTPMFSSNTGGNKVPASRKLFAADSESDLIADVNAFRKCEAALRSMDIETVESLAQVHFISTSTVKYMLKVARQLCDELHLVGLLPALDPDQSVFASIPADLNKHAACVPLLKALSMNLYNSDLALRKGRLLQSFTTSGGEKSLISHRGVNFLAKQEESVRKLRRPNDLLSYITRRQDTETPTTSWLGHTSMVTPLIAAIFCRSMHLPEEQENTMLLNDWIQMQVNIDHTGFEAGAAVKIIYEFRKALERFCTLALTEMDKTASRQPELAGNGRSSDVPPYAPSLLNGNQDAGWQDQKQEDQQDRPTILVSEQLRTSFVDGVVKALEADDLVLREMFARNALEVEQRRLQSEADRREHEATKLRLRQST
ncbi:hypothetical protein DV738_g3604, partial [Chaetothyriales sp. CBS 135597]